VGSTEPATRNARTYNGTTDVVLEVAGVEGLSMRVRAGSVTLTGGRRPSPAEPATLGLHAVHFDDIPMPLPYGAAPPFAWTLQPAAWGGGLRLWDLLFDGRPDTDLDPDQGAHVTVRAEAGDALLIDSRRLHQIRPFRGDAHRVSITVHAAEVDRGVWETWF